MNLNDLIVQLKMIQEDAPLYGPLPVRVIVRGKAVDWQITEVGIAGAALIKVEPKRRT